MNNPSHANQFEQLRPKLVAFAVLQTKHHDQAEDLVQESILAALEGAENYAGTARFETWVYSILRNKLIDFIRKSQRERERFQRDDQEINLDNFFDDREHWDMSATPCHWKSPEDLHMRKDFWEVFDLCLLHLPSSTAQVFAMRELMDMETQDICSSLEISEQNCWTILHRARLKLRACLEKGWFQKEEKCSI